MGNREAVVIYDSVYGNTRQIAEAIAAVLRERFQVHVYAATELDQLPVGVDLLVIGSPTHRHGVSEGMRTLLDDVRRGAVRGVPFAAIDTRYPGAAWLTGSAADRIAKTLRGGGAQLVIPPESFFIEMDAPPRGEKRHHDLERLKEGELERASEWARRLLETIAPVLPVVEAAAH